MLLKENYFIVTDIETWKAIKNLKHNKKYLFNLKKKNGKLPKKCQKIIAEDQNQSQFIDFQC